jgi:hypothetical protein
MRGQITVEPDPAYPAGHAVIRVPGAGHVGGSTSFRISRDDYDDGVFGTNGWQVADELLTPDAGTTDGDDLLLHIGPSVVQRVVSGIYRVAVPAAHVDMPVSWPDLPLLTDEALNMVAEPTRGAPRVVQARRPVIQRQGQVATAHEDGIRTPPKQPKPDATADTIQARPITPPIDPAPRPIAPPPQTRTRLPWVALLAVLILAGGVGGYFAYYHWLSPPAVIAEQSPPETPSAPPSVSPPTSPPSQGPDLQHMSAGDALRSGASPEALLREAERRMQLDGPQRSEALLLMQGAADSDRNYAPAHAALARLYDPSLQHPPEIQPDARQAAIHYRSAIRGGDNSVADARAALKAYLEQQSQRGDLYAPLILKEFWP